MADCFWWHQHNIAQYCKIYHFLIYIIEGIFTSKHNMEITKKNEKLLKTRKKKISDIFFHMTSSEKGLGLGLP